MEAAQDHITINAFAVQDDGSLDFVVEALVEAGADPTVVEALGSAPLGEILVIATVAPPGVVFVVSALRKNFRRGVLIDGYEGQLTIRQDKTLPRGMVVVRQPEGSITVSDGEQLGQSFSEALGSAQSPAAGQ